MPTPRPRTFSWMATGPAPAEGTEALPQLVRPVGLANLLPGPWVARVERPPGASTRSGIGTRRRPRRVPRVREDHLAGHADPDRPGQLVGPELVEEDGERLVAEKVKPAVRLQARPVLLEGDQARVMAGDDQVDLLALYQLDQPGFPEVVVLAERGEVVRRGDVPRPRGRAVRLVPGDAHLDAGPAERADYAQERAAVVAEDQGFASVSGGTSVTSRVRASAGRGGGRFRAGEGDTAPSGRRRQGRHPRRTCSRRTACRAVGG